MNNAAKNDIYFVSTSLVFLPHVIEFDWGKEIDLNEVAGNYISWSLIFKNYTSFV